MHSRRAEKLLLALLAAYGAWLVFIWVALRLAADRTWWGTVLLYTPRWFWAAPLLPFGIAVPLVARRWLPGLGLLALGALAVMHVELPWRKLVPEPVPKQILRVLSCNCDFNKLEFERLKALVADFDPDIVAVQLIWPDDFVKVFKPDQWHTVVDFRLGLASRYPILKHEYLKRQDFVEQLISGDDFRLYQLDVDGQTLHFANLHLQSPRFGLRAVIRHFWDGARELDQYTHMRRFEAEAIREWLAPYPDIVIAGDFNTPLESPTYRLNFGGYLNAFSSAGWGVGNTFRPTWWTGLRIDHILAGSGWWCRSCRIGRTIGPEHRAVMAELAR